MTDSVNQWELFGVDTRSLGRYWSTAWREFLFASDSPIRGHLDEVVRLHDGDQLLFVHNGRELLNEPDEATCRAFIVPDDFVLTREIHVPLSALAEVQSVVDLELAALSPFEREDTVSGWSEVGRDEGTARIALAVCSKLAINRWFASLALVAESEKVGAELWARAGSAFVAFNLPEEYERDRLYRRRLLRVSALVGGVLLALLVSASLFSFQQKVALDKLSDAASIFARDTRGAVAARDSLVLANEVLSKATVVQEDYPNPHLELARLTKLLGDDTFVTHFSSRGRELRVRGRSSDAALVMQSLASDAAYEAVEALGPITTVGNSGLEQFNLKIEIKSDEEDPS
ncbi:MAG: PilN domain-containing protein [Pseudomonadota bacterium]